jgi:hypothetical protein
VKRSVRIPARVLEGVVRPAWRDLVVTREKGGAARVNRINYEIAALHTVRDKLRCKELWVADAARLRNPNDDVPADFAARRGAYYQALRLPLDPAAFIATLKGQLGAALQALDAVLPTNPDVTLLRKSGGWIKLSPLAPQPEPLHLERLQAELRRRRPMTSLLDMLKEADLRVGFTKHFASVAGKEQLDPATLQKRLLLCLYGLGTNTGLRRVSGAAAGASYGELR